MRIDIDKLPFFLTGDFNGDGNRDIAVLVNIEKGREELASHNVKTDH